MKKMLIAGFVSLLIAESSMMAAISYDFSAQEENISSLIAAVEQDDSARVSELLAINGNTEMCDSCGRTPFLIAVAHGNLEMVDLLMQYGASVTAIDVLGNNALHIAVHNEKTVLIPWLIELGLDMYDKNFEGRSPLRIALEKGGGELLEALIPDAQ